MCRDKCDGCRSFEIVAHLACEGADSRAKFCDVVKSYPQEGIDWEILPNFAYFIQQKVTYKCMADRMTKEQRHRCMSHIKGRNTKPELLVRKFLWRCGFRYRLYDKRLPGKPDIIMRKWKTVIFVNGCFWHGHNCEDFRPPKTNVEFWETKIETNRKRDLQNIAKLKLLGFRVITIWECELTKNKREQTLDSLWLTLSKIVLAENNAKTYNFDDDNSLIAAEPSEGYEPRQNNYGEEN